MVIIIQEWADLSQSSKSCIPATIILMSTTLCIYGVTSGNQNGSVCQLSIVIVVSFLGIIIWQVSGTIQLDLAVLAILP